jgi:hypothetical protein
MGVYWVAAETVWVIVKIAIMTVARTVVVFMFDMSMLLLPPRESLLLPLDHYSQRDSKIQLRKGYVPGLSQSRRKKAEKSDLSRLCFV